MTAVETPRPATLSRRALRSGQSVPRKEDRRLVQGQGVFFDDIKRHGHGLPPLRPLAVRPREDRLDRRLRGARAARRVRHADGRRGRDPDRSVLPDRGAARRRTSRTTRSRSARCATSASRSSPSSPRRASSRATPPSSSRSSTSRSPVVVDARKALDPDGAACCTRSAGQPVVVRRVGVGRRRRGVRRGRPRRQDQGAPLRPLQLDAARVRRRARRVQPRHRASGRCTRTTSSPASRRS